MRNIKALFLCILTGTFLFSTGCDMPEKPNNMQEFFSMIGFGQDESDGSGYLFRCSIMGNPKNLDPQLATDKSSLMIIENMFTGLMDNDINGKLENGAAEKYEVSADGLKYTFTLRDNCYWYGLELQKDTRVTAKDFEYAFKRIFNPEIKSPYSDTFKFLKNAEKIINGEADLSELGVYSTGDNSITFELDYPCSDFLNLLTTSPAMPCNEEFFKDTKGQYGLNQESTASNGAFYIKQWFYDEYGKDNFIIMKKNQKNTDYNKIYPSSLNFFIEKTDISIMEKFKMGSVDCFVANYEEKAELRQTAYKIDEYQASTLGLVFSAKEDNIFSDERLRSALSLSIDRNVYEKDLSETLSNARGVISPIITLNGKLYREQVDENSFSELNTQKAAEIWNEALEEKGVYSLDSKKIMVTNQMMDSTYLHYVTQQWQAALNCFIGIDVVTDKEYEKRMASGDYDIAVMEITGEFNNPYSFMRVFADETTSFIKCSDDFNSIYKIAGETTDNTGENSQQLYYDMEKSVLSNHTFIPLFYNTNYLIYNNNCDDIILNPFTGQIDFRYAKYFE